MHYQPDKKLRHSFVPDYVSDQLAEIVVTNYLGLEHKFSESEPWE